MLVRLASALASAAREVAGLRAFFMVPSMLANASPAVKSPKAASWLLLVLLAGLGLGLISLSLQPLALSLEPLSWLAGLLPVVGMVEPVSSRELFRRRGPDEPDVTRRVRARAQIMRIIGLLPALGMGIWLWAAPAAASGVPPAAAPGSGAVIRPQPGAPPALPAPDAATATLQVSRTPDGTLSASVEWAGHPYRADGVERVMLTVRLWPNGRGLFQEWLWGSASKASEGGERSARAFGMSQGAMRAFLERARQAGPQTSWEQEALASISEEVQALLLPEEAIHFWLVEARLFRERGLFKTARAVYHKLAEQAQAAQDAERRVSILREWVAAFLEQPVGEPQEAERTYQLAGEVVEAARSLQDRWLLLIALSEQLRAHQILQRPEETAGMIREADAAVQALAQGPRAWTEERREELEELRALWTALPQGSTPQEKSIRQALQRWVREAVRNRGRSEPSRIPPAPSTPAPQPKAPQRDGAAPPPNLPDRAANVVLALSGWVAFGAGMLALAGGAPWAEASQWLEASGQGLGIRGQGVGVSELWTTVYGLWTGVLVGMVEPSRGGEPAEHPNERLLRLLQDIRVPPFATPMPEEALAETWRATLRDIQALDGFIMQALPLLGARHPVLCNLLQMDAAQLDVMSSWWPRLLPGRRLLLEELVPVPQPSEDALKALQMAAMDWVSGYALIARAVGDEVKQTWTSAYAPFQEQPELKAAFQRIRDALKHSAEGLLPALLRALSPVVKSLDAPDPQAAGEVWRQHFGTAYERLMRLQDVLTTFQGIVGKPRELAALQEQVLAAQAELDRQAGAVIRGVIEEIQQAMIEALDRLREAMGDASGWLTSRHRRSLWRMVRGLWEMAVELPQCALDLRGRVAMEAPALRAWFLGIQRIERVTDRMPEAFAEPVQELLGQLPALGELLRAAAQGSNTDYTQSLTQWRQILAREVPEAAQQALEALGTRLAELHAAYFPDQPPVGASEPSAEDQPPPGALTAWVPFVVWHGWLEGVAIGIGLIGLLWIIPQLPRWSLFTARAIRSGWRGLARVLSRVAGRLPWLVLPGLLALGLWLPDLEASWVLGGLAAATIERPLGPLPVLGKARTWRNRREALRLWELALTQHRDELERATGEVSNERLASSRMALEAAFVVAEGLRQLSDRLAQAAAGSLPNDVQRLVEWVAHLRALQEGAEALQEARERDEGRIERLLDPDREALATVRERQEEWVLAAQQDIERGFLELQRSVKGMLDESYVLFHREDIMEEMLAIERDLAALLEGTRMVWGDAARGELERQLEERGWAIADLPTKWLEILHERVLPGWWTPGPRIPGFHLSMLSWVRDVMAHSAFVERLALRLDEARRHVSDGAWAGSAVARLFEEHGRALDDAIAESHRRLADARVRVFPVLWDAVTGVAVATIPIPAALPPAPAFSALEAGTSLPAEPEWGPIDGGMGKIKAAREALEWMARFLEEERERLPLTAYQVYRLHAVLGAKRRALGVAARRVARALGRLVESLPVPFLAHPEDQDEGGRWVVDMTHASDRLSEVLTRLMTLGSLSDRPAPLAPTRALQAKRRQLDRERLRVLTLAMQDMTEPEDLRALYQRHAFRFSDEPTRVRFERVSRRLAARLGRFGEGEWSSTDMIIGWVGLLWWPLLAWLAAGGLLALAGWAFISGQGVGIWGQGVGVSWLPTTVYGLGTGFIGMVESLRAGARSERQLARVSPTLARQARPALMRLTKAELGDLVRHSDAFWLFVRRLERVQDRPDDRPDGSATMPATYRVGARWGLSPRATERTLAWWMEELGLSQALEQLVARKLHWKERPVQATRALLHSLARGFSTSRLVPLAGFLVAHSFHAPSFLSGGLFVGLAAWTTSRFVAAHPPAQRHRALWTAAMATLLSGVAGAVSGLWTMDYGLRAALWALAGAGLAHLTANLLTRGPFTGSAVLDAHGRLTRRRGSARTPLFEEMERAARRFVEECPACAPVLEGLPLFVASRATHWMRGNTLDLVVADELIESVRVARDAERFVELLTRRALREAMLAAHPLPVGSFLPDVVVRTLEVKELLEGEPVARVAALRLMGLREGPMAEQWFAREVLWPAYRAEGVEHSRRPEMPSALEEGLLASFEGLLRVLMQERPEHAWSELEGMDAPRLRRGVGLVLVFLNEALPMRWVYAAGEWLEHRLALETVQNEIQGSPPVDMPLPPAWSRAEFLRLDSQALRHHVLMALRAWHAIPKHRVSPQGVAAAQRLEAGWLKNAAAGLREASAQARAEALQRLEAIEPLLRPYDVAHTIWPLLREAFNRERDPVVRQALQDAVARISQSVGGFQREPNVAHLIQTLQRASAEGVVREALTSVPVLLPRIERPEELADLASLAIVYLQGVPDILQAALRALVALGEDPRLQPELRGSILRAIQEVLDETVVEEGDDAFEAVMEIRQAAREALAQLRGHSDDSPQSREDLHGLWPDAGALLAWLEGLARPWILDWPAAVIVALAGLLLALAAVELRSGDPAFGRHGPWKGSGWRLRGWLGVLGVVTLAGLLPLGAGVGSADAALVPTATGPRVMVVNLSPEPLEAFLPVRPHQLGIEAPEGAQVWFEDARAGTRVPGRVAADGLVVSLQGYATHGLRLVPILLLLLALLPVGVGSALGVGSFRWDDARWSGMWSMLLAIGPALPHEEAGARFLAWLEEPRAERRWAGGRLSANVRSDLAHGRPRPLILHVGSSLGGELARAAHWRAERGDPSLIVGVDKTYHNPAVLSRAQTAIATWPDVLLVHAIFQELPAGVTFERIRVLFPYPDLIVSGHEAWHTDPADQGWAAHLARLLAPGGRLLVVTEISELSRLTLPGELEARGLRAHARAVWADRLPEEIARLLGPGERRGYSPLGLITASRDPLDRGDAPLSGFLFDAGFLAVMLGGWGMAALGSGWLMLVAGILAGRRGGSLAAQSDFLQGHLFQSRWVTKALQRIKDLDSRKLAMRIVIGGNALRKMLRRYRRFLEPDVQGIHFGIIRDSHQAASLAIVGVDRDDDEFPPLFHKDRPDLFGGVEPVVPHSVIGRFVATFHPVQFRRSPRGRADGFHNFRLGRPAEGELLPRIVAQPDGLRGVHMPTVSDGREEVKGAWLDLALLALGPLLDGWLPRVFDWWSWVAGVLPLAWLALSSGGMEPAIGGLAIALAIAPAPRYRRLIEVPALEAPERVSRLLRQVIEEELPRTGGGTITRRRLLNLAAAPAYKAFSRSLETFLTKPDAEPYTREELLVLAEAAERAVAARALIPRGVCLNCALTVLSQAALLDIPSNPVPEAPEDEPAYLILTLAPSEIAWLEQTGQLQLIRSAFHGVFDHFGAETPVAFLRFYRFETRLLVTTIQSILSLPGGFHGLLARVVSRAVRERWAAWERWLLLGLHDYATRLPDVTDIWIVSPEHVRDAAILPLSSAGKETLERIYRRVPTRQLGYELLMDGGMQVKQVREADERLRLFRELSAPDPLLPGSGMLVEEEPTPFEERLIARLSHPDVRRRAEALVASREYVERAPELPRLHRRLVAALRQRLFDPEPDVRLAAAITLRSLVVAYRGLSRHQPLGVEVLLDALAAIIRFPGQGGGSAASAALTKRLLEQYRGIAYPPAHPQSLWWNTVMDALLRQVPAWYPEARRLVGSHPDPAEVLAAHPERRVREGLVRALQYEAIKIGLRGVVWEDLLVRAEAGATMSENAASGTQRPVHLFIHGLTGLGTGGAWTVPVFALAGVGVLALLTHRWWRGLWPWLQGWGRRLGWLGVLGVTGLILLEAGATSAASALALGLPAVAGMVEPTFPGSLASATIVDEAGQRYGLKVSPVSPLLTDGLDEEWMIHLVAIPAVDLTTADPTVVRAALRRAGVTGQLAERLLHARRRPPLFADETSWRWAASLDFEVPPDAIERLIPSLRRTVGFVRVRLRPAEAAVEIDSVRFQPAFQRRRLYPAVLRLLAQEAGWIERVIGEIGNLRTLEALEQFVRARPEPSPGPMSRQALLARTVELARGNVEEDPERHHDTYVAALALFVAEGLQQLPQEAWPSSAWLTQTPLGLARSRAGFSRHALRIEEGGRAELVSEREAGPSAGSVPAGSVPSVFGRLSAHPQPHTAETIATSLGLTPTSRAIRRDLAELEALGLVIRQRAGRAAATYQVIPLAEDERRAVRRLLRVRYPFADVQRGDRAGAIAAIRDLFFHSRPLRAAQQDAFIEILATGRPAAQRAAAIYLGRMGDQEAADALIDVLTNPGINVAVRHAALESLNLLWRFFPVVDVEQLVRVFAVTGQWSAIRRMAHSEELGLLEVLPHVLDLLAHPTSRIRQRVPRVLKELLEDADGVRQLREEFAHDRHPEILPPTLKVLSEAMTRLPEGPARRFIGDLLRGLLALRAEAWRRAPGRSHPGSRFHAVAPFTLVLGVRGGGIEYATETAWWGWRAEHFLGGLQLAQVPEWLAWVELVSTLVVVVGVVALAVWLGRLSWQLLRGMTWKHVLTWGIRSTPMLLLAAGLVLWGGEWADAEPARRSLEQFLLEAHEEK